MKRRLYIYMAIVCAAAVSCIYPYEVDLKEGTSGTVVISGDILCGEISKFDISLTQSVSDTVSDVFGVHELYVEGEDGSRYDGTGSKYFIPNYQGGSVGYASYEVDTRNLDKNIRYRFVAKISKGVDSKVYAKTYSTDFMPVLISPPIDSISYKVADDSMSVAIQVTTHDDNKPVGCYRWTYEENWEVVSEQMATHAYSYYSNSVYEIDFESQNRYYCWGKSVSSDFYLFNTREMGANVAPLVTIQTLDREEKKLSRLYCIDVTQFVVSEENYRFWETMRKNSGSVGDIYSPQPGKPRGNIVCEEDRDEYVIGAVSCSTISTLRRFITREEFGIYYNPYDCGFRNFDRGQWQTAYMEGFDIVTIMEGVTPPYLWAKEECVDCTLYGTKNKPDFWPTDNN